MNKYRYGVHGADENTAGYVVHAGWGEGPFDYDTFGPYDTMAEVIEAIARIRALPESFVYRGDQWPNVV